MQQNLNKFGLMLKTVFKKMVARDPFFAYFVQQNGYIHPAQYTMKRKVRKYSKP